MAMQWPQQLQPNSSAGHLIDINEVNQEEMDDNNVSSPPKRGYKPKPHRLRDTKRSFSRQVSLETGFSALKEREDGIKYIPRSGRSFGGFGKINGNHIGEAVTRKGDFNMFRTKSTLSKQNSFLPMKDTKANYQQKNFNNANSKDGSNQENDDTSVPAGRYFAALRGPELDQVKDTEANYQQKNFNNANSKDGSNQENDDASVPAGSFGVCLGLSSQAILWLALATSPATRFLHVTPYINLVIWVLGVVSLFLVSTVYVLKAIFYFEAVRREYFHPVRVNFFFAPWVVCMFLALGTPKMIAPGPPNPVVFCVFMTPTFLLELKIYGQWLSGGKRRLSKVANPSSHLSVVGNFVGAILAAKAGWTEPAKFLWAVGFAQYMVVFVTLYQRLPTSEVLPKELHLVYSMFIAAPSAASIAWVTIYGEFDGLARTCFFIALFLYISLVIRVKFFTGFRFSLAWWSYTFPMTTTSIATIKYAEQVPSVETKVLALSLVFMSTTMVSILCICTVVHGLYWRTLFPNDLAIAIARKKPGKEMKQPKKFRAYDIRRWTKQSPLAFVSAKTKNNADNEECIVDKFLAPQS
ncbi:hypothetical protein V2J09_022047 [Rumex salicifolius]